MKSSCVVWRWIPTNDFPTSVNSSPRWIHSWLCHHRPTFPRRLDRTTIPRKIPSSKSAAKGRTKAKCPRSSTVKPKRRSGVRRARKRTANQPRSGTRKPSNPRRRYPTRSRLRPKPRPNRPTRLRYFTPNAFSGIKRKKRGPRPAARGVEVARACFFLVSCSSVWLRRDGFTRTPSPRPSNHSRPRKTQTLRLLRRRRLPALRLLRRKLRHRLLLRH